MEPRIAITGANAWSCFGRGLEPLREALRQDRSGWRPITRLPTEARVLRTRHAMLADEIGPAEDPWRQAVDIAVDVASDAVAEARLPLDRIAPRRIAVLNGTTHGTEGWLEYLRQRRTGPSPNASLLREGAWGTAHRIATRIGASGPNITVSTSCSSATNAIGQACRLLELDEVDCAIAGGNDLVSTLSYFGFNGLALLSRNGCRPLDTARDGMSLGDGAAYVVLEREADALARSAPVLGRVVGYACASEGHHPTAPDPEGLCPIRVMRAALARDDAPHELGLVAAHGTGTPANDEVEVRAIQRVVEAIPARGPVDVVALKSRLGHTLGAAGALELVATLACMRDGLSPGTAGLETPVPHDAPLRLERGPRHHDRPIPLALCNAFGFGGSVASIALRIP